MMHFTERVLTDELAEAKCLLQRALAILDAHDEHAAALAKLGVPTFACTPDLFPELLAAAIARQDISLWAARQDIALARAG